MKPILIIGPIFCDLLLKGFSRLPLRGEELPLDDYNLSIGGVAITAAVLAQLEIPCSLLSVTGQDLLGNKLVSILNDLGVEIPNLIRAEEFSTNLSIVLPIEDDRSFLTYEDAQERSHDAIAARLEAINMDDYSHIHISFSLLRNPFILDLLTEARKSGLSISSDVSFADVEKWQDSDFGMLSILDFFFPNVHEALIITKSENARDALHRLGEYVKTPIITKGPEGVAALDGKGNLIEIQPPQVEVLNTTGAGDSFTAGFLYGRIIGLNLSESLSAGSIVGSLTANSEDSYSHQISRNALNKMRPALNAAQRYNNLAEIKG